jgi:hypothetical protein
MHKLIYVLLFFSSMVTAMDHTIEIQRIKPEKTIPQLMDLQKSMTIKPIYGCVFSDQVAMNASLLRAGLYVHTKMGMASDGQRFSSHLMSAVRGHDFNGEELSNYN